MSKIKLSGEKSKEILSRIIRSEFDKLDKFIYVDEIEALIELAEKYDLKELSKQMKKDL